MVRTQHVCCRKPRFNPCWGTEISQAMQSGPKEKEKKNCVISTDRLNGLQTSFTVWPRGSTAAAGE